MTTVVTKPSTTAILDKYHNARTPVQDDSSDGSSVGDLEYSVRDAVPPGDSDVVQVASPIRRPGDDAISSNEERLLELESDMRAAIEEFSADELSDLSISDDDLTLVGEACHHVYPTGSGQRRGRVSRHTSERTPGAPQHVTRQPTRIMTVLQPEAPDPSINMFKKHVLAQRRCLLLKNLGVVCVAFVLNFTAFQNIQNLQSSLNSSQALGTVSLSVVYGSLIISALLIPPWLILHLGCKWTMAICLLPYALYVVANMYPHWATLMPASLLLGLAAAPLWAAKCTYLSELAGRLSTLTGQYKHNVISRFFGIFFMAFQTTQIWGNLISGFILQDVPETNQLLEQTDPAALAKCGLMYCTNADSTNNTNLERPNYVKVYTLLGTYVCLCVLAFLTLSLCLDPLSSLPGGPPLTISPPRGSVIKRLVAGCDVQMAAATCSQWRRPQQLLLVPITVYSGLEQAFLAGDFTRSYVSCTLGVWMVGMVMICFGVANALCCLALAHLTKVTGRTPMFSAGAALHCVLLVLLFLWRPVAPHIGVFFVVAGLWGAGDAVWQTQLNALYGNLFWGQKEAAFSNYRLWESIGFIVAFAYSGFLCTYVKIYILMGTLVVGMIGYYCVEWMARSRIYT